MTFDIKYLASWFATVLSRSTFAARVIVRVRVKVKTVRAENK